MLENAVKYGPAGSLIRVDCYRADADICIAVTDEGVGIPPSDLKNVFDSFFRASRGDRAAAGTGLRPWPGDRARNGRGDGRLHRGAEPAQ